MISTIVLATAVAATAAAKTPHCPSKPAPIPSNSTAKNVVLLSIDGMHEGDLAYLVKNLPNSNIAQLASGGLSFSNAQTTLPSDSFPGLASIVTGASPKTHGFYYDVAWSREFYATGDVTCAGPVGNAFNFDEFVDINANQTSQTLSGLDGGCKGYHFGHGCGINAALLPYKKINGKCSPVYPHTEMRVNTVYEVAKNHGYFTAHADKHIVYDFLNGPSGEGVIDLYTPEQGFYSNVESSFDFVNNTYYDDLHVEALVNWINGKDHAGVSYNTAKKAYKGFVVGSNFQLISIGQKMAPAGSPDNVTGGYLDAAYTPSPYLAKSFQHMDLSIGKIVAALKDTKQWDETLVILTAKHGQSSVDPTLLRKLGSDLLTSLLSNNGSIAADAFTFTNDDAAYIWYRNASEVAPACLRLKANAVALGADGPTASINCGNDIVTLFGADPKTDSKVPDIAIISNPGVIYTSSKAKIAEHGGGSFEDRAIPLVLAGGYVSSSLKVVGGGKVASPVQGKQIAPTILEVLGVNGKDLQGVKTEGTVRLPFSNACDVAVVPSATTTGASSPTPSTPIKSGALRESSGVMMLIMVASSILLL